MIRARMPPCPMFLSTPSNSHSLSYAAEGVGKHSTNVTCIRSEHVQANGSKSNGSNTSLVSALAAVSLQRQLEGLRAIQEAAVSAADRVQKFLEPLPRGFPPGPDQDVALALAADPLQTLEDLRGEFGGAVGFKLAGERVVLISDPVLAREVFVTQAEVFIKEGTAFFPGSSLAGNGLLVSDGEVWRRQRRLATPAFRAVAVETYARAMAEQAEGMVNSWGRGDGDGDGGDAVQRDVYADMNVLSMKIVATTLFGGGVEDVGPAITTAFDFFGRRGSSVLIVPEWFPTPDNIQYNAAVAELDEIVYRLIAQRRHQLAEGGGGQVADPDLLTRLLEALEEDGSGMDDVALRDELMTLLVAVRGAGGREGGSDQRKGLRGGRSGVQGQETSAILLAWTCALLAQHPGVQEKVAEEVRRVVGGRRAEARDVHQLKFTEAVIYESMRLLPPAYIVGRCASRPTHLGRWQLPAGTTVLVSPYLLHRDPHHWPRALEFDPERWMEGGDAVAPRDNDSYWPFGGGPRNCIGMGFAMMESILVVASIIRECRLELPAGKLPPKPRAMITLRPEGSVDLVIRPR